MRSVFVQLHNVKKMHRGFSIIELLVTIGIVIMVIGSVLVKQTAFNSTALLRAQAQEVALDIRRAQQYGVNTRADQENLYAAYGVYFNVATPGQYQLYLDADGDQVYDTNEAVGAPFVLDDRFVITSICIQGVCNVGEVSIAFQRPDFDAAIYYSGGRASLVQVVIASQADMATTRSISVYDTGQIAVE